MIAAGSLLLILGWAILGGAAGWFVRWGSVRLARLEELEPGAKWWQVYGPPILGAVLFTAFASEPDSFSVLVVRSVFVLVLVQVIFFDFEHRLILDRGMFPSMVAALVASLFRNPWWAGIADRGWRAAFSSCRWRWSEAPLSGRGALASATSSWHCSWACCWGPCPPSSAFLRRVLAASFRRVDRARTRTYCKNTIGLG